MSKLADKLGAQKIYNNYDALRKLGGPTDLVIEYHCPPSGRLGWSSYKHTRVWSLVKQDGLAIDDKGLITTLGFKKDFNGDRAISLPIAIEWVQRHLNKEEFVPSPFGGKIPASPLTKLKEMVK